MRDASYAPTSQTRSVACLLACLLGNELGWVVIVMAEVDLSLCICHCCLKFAVLLNAKCRQVSESTVKMFRTPKKVISLSLESQGVFVVASASSCTFCDIPLIVPPRLRPCSPCSSSHLFMQKSVSTHDGLLCPCCRNNSRKGLFLRITCLYTRKLFRNNRYLCLYVMSALRAGIRY